MIEDDSFQADGKPEGVLYGFLTQGANIQRGGRFVGQIVGVEAACDNGPAISALGNNFNSSGEEGGGAVSVVNGAAGPGLDAESRGGAGIFGKGATNGVHGQTSSPNDSGVWGENTGHGFGAAGSSSAIGVFGGLPGSQGLLGKPSTAVGLWGTTVTLQYPSDNGDGVLGEGKNGVHGRSRSPMDSGVYGENTGGGTGVAGLTNGENGPKGTVAGVWGVNQGAGAGVRGTGGKTGVLGECNGRLGSNGVHGFGAAEGSGVRGTGGVYGVIGEGPIGVRGESSVQGVFSASIGVLAESTVGGTGLRANASGGTGVSASGGLGGVFEGSIAPLQLVPSQIPGHPTSGQHSMGELYVDVQGVLWFCIASGTSGGTWKRVQLV